MYTSEVSYTSSLYNSICTTQYLLFLMYKCPSKNFMLLLLRQGFLNLSILFSWSSVIVELKVSSNSGFSILNHPGTGIEWGNRDEE